MKLRNCITATAILLLPVWVQAQKPTSGDFSTELSLNFTGAGSTISFNSAPLGGLKGRYFLQDHLALRMSLLAGMSDTRTPIVPPAGFPAGEVRTQGSSIGFYAGIEKHFAGTAKLSPYAGADVGFVMNRQEITWSNTSNGATYTFDYNRRRSSGNGGVGLNIVTGADYYVAEKVFVGAEFGLGFFMGRNMPVKTTYSGSAAPATNPSDVQANSYANVNLFTVSGIRLGIIF